MKRFNMLALAAVVVFALSAFLASCGGGGGSSNGGGGSSNKAPVANAGPNQYVATKIQVTLDGSGSTDANSDPLTYSWSFTSKPASSTAVLSSATVSNPTFTADKDGAYVLSLVVNDGTVDSAADTVTITAATPFPGSATGKMPDTNQVLCSNASGTAISCAGTGQDGIYSINTPSYTDNSNGTITDNVTGLIWQKCTNGQSGTDCATGTAATYNWYEAAGIYDVTSNPSTTDVCGALTLAGQTDWRLPSQIELVSLIDNSGSAPAINAIFPLTVSSGYWSSTGNVINGNTNGGRAVIFNVGSLSVSLKTSSTSYARCVRGGQ